MNVIIAGGRDYHITYGDVDRLDAEILPVVGWIFSGGAPGADAGGEEWARSRGVPVRRFRADWDRHGRAAGPIRNEEMARMADACVLLPGGRGTEDMARRARYHGLTIFDWRSRGGGR